ncbi:hypothetical protein QJS04_geneDACA005991 [Acorus gramineus]|uniref:F-box domain-containing protein n=1 Tax=Acorus gramineus TaxID=55184 RepID=A0AAV9B6Z6_ACOGR|nr:hypothetical protein QJS04_geneDACA005991 [Acorus gramineus]
MAADWSELPKDILFSIAMRAEHLSDYIRFGAVCKSWRFAVIGNTRPLHLGFPLLFVSRRTTANNNNNRPDHAPRDASDPPQWGAGFAWPTTADVYILNVFTGAVVTLPPLTTNVISGGDRPLQIRCDDSIFKMVAVVGFKKNAHLYKVIFSTEPTDPTEFDLFHR